MADDKRSYAHIDSTIAILNRALGHTRGTPRITLDTATTAQRLLVVALEAFYEARQCRLDLDSALARAEILMESAGISPRGAAQRG